MNYFDESIHTKYLYIFSIFSFFSAIFIIIIIVLNLVYSIVTKSSFRVAEEILNYLWRENVTKDKAVIVVGNKADLARSRVISTTGKGFGITF